MLDLEFLIKKGITEACHTLWKITLEPGALALQATRKEFEGTYTFVTFGLAKEAKLSPEDCGTQIGEFLQTQSGLVSRFNVVKGFLNLVISDQVWIKLLSENILNTQFGLLPSKNQKVMVEYSSPNTNKPLHLGHLRNNFLGYSVAEILKASGYSVLKANLINDRGIHICKSMLAYQLLGNGETPQSSSLKGDHLVGKYYVEFDKMLKAELKPILAQIQNKDLKAFDPTQQVELTKALEGLELTEKEYALELDKVKNLKFDLGSEFTQALQLVVQELNGWKSFCKSMDSLFPEDWEEKKKEQKQKEITKVLKPLLSLEEKRAKLNEAIKDIAQTKVVCLQQAQEMLWQWEQGNPEVLELWKRMNGWVYDGFEATYKKIGVDFDKYYYESDTYKLGKALVEEGLASNVFYKKDNGSAWIDLSTEGQDHKLVLRADGTSVYITQDLGTAQLKYDEFGCDHSVYVVGNEQDRHFVLLKLILKKLGKKYAEGIFHLSYGMVDLPSGKMKSREGTVVDADDLVNELEQQIVEESKAREKKYEFSPEEEQKLTAQLALGALKYFLLKVDPQKRMLFNPAESINLNGNTGPFIQYTHARIRAILRQVQENGVSFSSDQWKSIAQLHESEGRLIELLNRYPAVIEEAARNYAPSVMANYAYEVAKEYNRFYTECPVLKENEASIKAMRIALCDASGKVIAKAMSLLGIEVPERM